LDVYLSQGGKSISMLKKGISAAEVSHHGKWLLCREDSDREMASKGEKKAHRSAASSLSPQGARLHIGTGFFVFAQL
jgi:hypothetical protein